MKRYFLALLVFLVLLTGCTTVDDFRKMSSSERARRVCERRQNIVNLVNQKSSLSTAIQRSQTDLGRGYKVHKQCQQVKVYGQATTTCQNLGGIVSCSENRPESYETRCTESPVAINADLERQNIQSWSEALFRTDQNLRNEWQSCARYIGNMTAEEAYSHYK